MARAEVRHKDGRDSRVPRHAREEIYIILFRYHIAVPFTFWTTERSMHLVNNCCGFKVYVKRVRGHGLRLALAVLPPEHGTLCVLTIGRVNDEVVGTTDKLKSGLGEIVIVRGDDQERRIYRSQVSVYVT